MIILFVFLFGAIIQFSRSNFVLATQENESLLEERKDILEDTAMIANTLKNKNNYCIVYKGSDGYSTKLKDNASRALQYMKKKTTPIDIEVLPVDVKSCHAIILTTDKLDHIGKVEEIEKYVFQGGHIFFMSLLDTDTNYQILYRKFGVSSFGGTVETRGIKLVSNVFIGEKDLSFDDEFILNSSMSVTLDDQTEQLATSINDLPLLWKSEYGKGTFMTFNGTMLEEKINRGFFTGAISLLEPNFIYPIFNFKVFFIDDFPAPIVKGKTAVIYDEYKRDTPSFYREIWWPQMLKISRNYNIKYTGAMIESYNNRVIPPFDNVDDKDSHFLISFGREIIKSGGELGFHGYNHQSLVTDLNFSTPFGYNEWKQPDDMSESIEELLDYSNSAFPEYKITSYVPPSNVLSVEGREAMKKAWPDLTVISSLYGEDADELSYIQEFEVAKDGIIEMPRVTSGYFEKDYDRWAEANTMTGLGVFSHFVHPDDVISSDRSNNMGWGSTYQFFNQYMSRIQNTYPWLRAMTATEAALDMAKLLQTDMKWEISETSIKGEIVNYQSGISYILRTKSNIKRTHNCKAEEIDANTYLVTAQSAEFQIDLEGS